MSVSYKLLLDLLGLGPLFLTFKYCCSYAPNIYNSFSTLPVGLINVPIKRFIT